MMLRSHIQSWSKRLSKMVILPLEFIVPFYQTAALDCLNWSKQNYIVDSLKLKSNHSLHLPTVSFSTGNFCRSWKELDTLRVECLNEIIHSGDKIPFRPPEDKGNRSVQSRKRKLQVKYLKTKKSIENGKLWWAFLSQCIKKKICINCQSDLKIC